jgi:hypothetical protein
MRPEIEGIEIKDADVQEVTDDKIVQGQIVDPSVMGIRNKIRRQQEHAPDHNMECNVDVFGFQRNFHAY